MMIQELPEPEDQIDRVIRAEAAERETGAEAETEATTTVPNIMSVGPSLTATTPAGVDSLARAPTRPPLGSLEFLGKNRNTIFVKAPNFAMHRQKIFKTGTVQVLGYPFSFCIRSFPRGSIGSDTDTEHVSIYLFYEGENTETNPVNVRFQIRTKTRNGPHCNCAFAPGPKRFWGHINFKRRIDIIREDLNSNGTFPIEVDITIGTKKRDKFAFIDGVKNVFNLISSALPRYFNMTREVVTTTVENIASAPDRVLGFFGYLFCFLFLSLPFLPWTSSAIDVIVKVLPSYHLKLIPDIIPVESIMIGLATELFTFGIVRKFYTIYDDDGRSDNFPLLPIVNVVNSLFFSANDSILIPCAVLGTEIGIAVSIYSFFFSTIDSIIPIPGVVFGTEIGIGINILFCMGASFADMFNNNDDDYDDECLSFGQCIVCMTAYRTHAFFPCGHLCVCQSCARRVAMTATITKCPLCNQEVVGSAIKIYIP